MRVLISSFILLGIWAADAAAQVRVDGYYRKDGTYVQPHVRSSPNGSTLDNYSTRGNVNPYTGKQGTVDPYGSRGGQGTYDPYGSSQRRRY